MTTSTILYKSMILAYIDYGDIIYEATNTANLMKLQRLQNQCLRICARSRDHIPTTELHCRYKVGILESRRQAHLNNYMFKQQNNNDLVDQRIIRTRAHDGTLFKVDIHTWKNISRALSIAVRCSGMVCRLLLETLPPIPPLNYYKKV